MKIKALPQEERPVEKTVSKGASALSNSELLAILLGSGMRLKILLQKMKQASAIWRKAPCRSSCQSAA